MVNNESQNHAGHNAKATDAASRAREDATTATLRSIYFAGGCFWGIEEYFARMGDVVSTAAGYANGGINNPTYQEVCTDTTGHAETVRVIFDPAVVDVATLCRRYFKVIDPTLLNRQGNDRGTQYRTGVYYVDTADRLALETVFNEERAKHDEEIVVELLPLQSFWPAEEYHQRYLQKNPGGYCHIRLD